jgi:hypothetical protein
MDRYSILLKKEYVIPRIPGEEFSWDYESRLRLVVMGGPRSGKTTYLINDLKNMTKIRKNPAKYIFCTSHGSLDHLRGLLTHYALSGSVYGTQIEVCSWNDFWPRTVSLQRALTVYFDDADGYQTMETKDSDQGIRTQPCWKPFNVRSLMAYAMGRLSNIPRIIIACDEHLIDFSLPTPKGNWYWKSEHLKKRGSL